MNVHSGLRLASGEEVVFATAAVLYETRTVRTRQGGAGGFSVRIMKGLTYRTGSSRGVSVTTQHIAPMCHGTFYITNKRSIFIGTLRAIEVSHGDLLAFEAFRDGLQIHSSRAKDLCLVGFDDGDAAALTLSRVLNGDAPSRVPSRNRSLDALIAGGAPRGSRNVSRATAVTVIGAALFAVVVIAAKLGGRVRRDEIRSAQRKETETRAPRDAVAELLARCGPPERDSTTNDGAAPVRRLAYIKKKLELSYKREGAEMWALTERSVPGRPGRQGRVTLTVAENRLPCATGLLALASEATRPLTRRPDESH